MLDETELDKESSDMEFEANEADDDCSSPSFCSSGGDPPSYRQGLKVVEQVEIGKEEDEEGEEEGEEGGKGRDQQHYQRPWTEGQVVPMSMERYKKSGNGSLPIQTIH